MGNKVSIDGLSSPFQDHHSDNEDDDPHQKYRSFPGSAMLEKTLCGSIDTTDPTEYRNVSTVNQLLKRAEILCVSSPVSQSDDQRKRYSSDDDENSIREPKQTEKASNLSSPHATSAMGGTTPTALTSGGTTPKASHRQTSKLLARALVSEVTDNPHTMKQAELQERERRLLKAAAAAAKHDATSAGTKHSKGKPVGASTAPHVLRSMAFACTGDENAVGELCPAMEGGGDESHGHLSAHGSLDDAQTTRDPAHTVTIGVALSRHSPSGHPGTITRQSTYDWNEVQDRALKYVSGVSAWRGGGGDATDTQPDQLHVPLLHLHCPTEASVEEVICVLASGEIFIPFMELLPEQVSTVHHSATGLTDLVVTFACERNDDVPVEEWPNWCLEFMHNQLYDYFSGSATWMKRSFSVTLAHQVRWKTVKHMNRYFEVSEAVVAKWRAQGPQRLVPSSSPSAGGASADEVARPHGIYLYRNGVPTNYFGPNFDPPYTTKMTRSLLTTVLQKSWDGKRREWSSRPVPRLAPPATLLSVACGYDPAGTTGFMAKEVTTVHGTGAIHKAKALDTQVPTAVTSTTTPRPRSASSPLPRPATPTQQPQLQEPLSEVEFGRSASGEVFGRSASGEASLKENHPKRPDQNNAAADSTYRQPVAERGALVHRHNEDGDTVSSVAHSTNYSVADSGTTVLQSNVSQPRKPFSRQQTRTAAGNKPSQANAVENKPIATADNRDRHGPLYSDEGSLEEGSTFSDDLSRDNGGKLVSPKWLQSPTREAAVQQSERSKNDATSKIMGSPVSMNSSPTKRAQFKMDREKAATTSSVASPRGRGGSVEAAGSMEYSTDGSSAFFTADAASLYGQHLSSHDGDATPSTTTTPSYPRYHVAAKKPLLEPMDRRYHKGLDDDDDESTLLSLQESSSSGMQSVAPTDEELFSVGWAKALDPNSGSYYYFTLDRTRTVWENPLTSSQYGDEMPPPVVAPSTTPLAQPQRRVVRAIDP